MKRASEFSAFTPLNNTGSDVMQGMIGGGGGVQRNGTSGSAFKRSSESSNSEKNKSQMRDSISGNGGGFGLILGTPAQRGASQVESLFANFTIPSFG